ncbi:MAG: hypothetical protein RIQ81_1103 [Pseudomonadota bacterium]|jgi:hypothetical protein
MNWIHYSLPFLLCFFAAVVARGEVEKHGLQQSHEATGKKQDSSHWLRPDPETISFIDAYRVAQVRHQVTAGYLSTSSEQEDYNPGSSRTSGSASSAGYRASLFTAALDPWDLVRIGAGYKSLSGRSTSRIGEMNAFQVEPSTYTEYRSTNSSSTASFVLAFSLPAGIGIAVGMDSESSGSTIRTEGQDEDHVESNYTRPRASLAWLLEGHQIGLAWHPSVIVEEAKAPVQIEREVSLVYHYLEGGVNLGVSLTHHGWKELDEKHQDKVSYALTSEQRTSNRVNVGLEGTYSPGYYTTFGSLDPQTMPKSSFGLRVNYAVTDHFEFVVKGTAVAKYRKKIEEQGYTYSSMNGSREYSAAVRGSF